MKKYILVFILVFMPFFASAEVPANTFFFMDGKGYDLSGTQSYFCFNDSNCYDLQGVFAFVKQAQTQINNLQNKVDNLQNQVNQLQSPVFSGYSQASSTPVVDNAVQSFKFFLDPSNTEVGGMSSTIDKPWMPIVVVGKLKNSVTATLIIDKVIVNDREIYSPLSGKIYSLSSDNRFYFPEINRTNMTDGSPVPGYLYTIHFTDSFHNGELSGAFSY